MIALQQKLVKLAQSILAQKEELELSEVFKNIQELYKLAVVYEFLSQQEDQSHNWQKHLDQLSENLGIKADEAAQETPTDPHEVAPLIETIKNMIPEMPEDTPPVKSLFEGIAPHPTFVKKEATQKKESTPETVVSDAQPKPNLNDQYQKKASFGLNDRLAFINQLFQGNATDFNRVVSQISTLNDWDSVENYLNTYIRPEYPNWADHQDLESRFIEHLKKTFTP